MKVAMIMGTRPEILKCAPIITKLNSKNSTIIFTGQHYDYSMGLKFIDQLNLRKPDYSLKVSRVDPAIQMGEMIKKLAPIFKEIDPDTVAVTGDTNTVLASGICAIKSGIPISHIESGDRSYDWRMPEEHNRRAIDHLSELLFPPTKVSANNLREEKVYGKIHMVGSTAVDAINMYSKISKKKSKLSITADNYVLMTLHRAENVDNKSTLSTIIKGVIDSKEKIIFTVHPRTKRRLHEFKLYKKLSESENIILLDSIGYFEILELIKNCLFILSDSGGVIQEATAGTIRKKTLIVRKLYEHPDVLKYKLGQLVSLDAKSITDSIKKTARNPSIKSKNAPFGNGLAGQKIIDVMRKTF